MSEVQELPTPAIPEPTRGSDPEEPVEIPRIDWADWVDGFEWEQGEHVALIGPTGSGKTTLLLSLLDLRTYVVVIGTKPRDATLSALTKQGYVRTAKWDKNLDPRTYPKRLLWPDAGRIDSSAGQRKAIYDALAQIFSVGCWTVVIDELWFLINHLKMEMVVRTYLQQSRALDISLVCATQRPAFVPLEVYDQSTHLFFWRDNDERNLKRISGLAYTSARQVKDTVARLERFEVLYVNTKLGTMSITKPPAKPLRRG